MKLFSSQHSDAPRRRHGASRDVRTPRPSAEGQDLFRRNRTLTGSASSHVSGAADESSSHLKSGRVHAHQLADQRRRIGGVLLIVSLSAIVLTILLWQFTASVTIATPGVNHAINTEKYEKAIQDYYARNPFERFRFATNQQALTEFVRVSAPEVDTLQLDGSAGFSESQVVIDMRRPIAEWTIDDTQYYVDGKGVSFQVNYFQAPSVRIVDNSGVELKAGTPIASKRFLGYVGRTVALSAEKGLVVEQVIIPEGTTRQLELSLKGYATPILLLIDRQVGEQVEDMARAIAYFRDRELNPEYIDVRVSGKAYYK